MIKPTQNKGQRIRDDLVRTLIFLFGMGMGAYFLFAWRNVLGIVFGLVFLIAGGRNMRAAWFPYGRLIESLFWLGIYSLAFLLMLLVWSLPTSGEEEGTNTAAILIGALLGYSLWDTIRSIKFVIQYLKMRDQEPPKPPDEEPV